LRNQGRCGEGGGGGGLGGGGGGGGGGARGSAFRGVGKIHGSESEGDIDGWNATHAGKQFPPGNTAAKETEKKNQVRTMLLKVGLLLIRGNEGNGRQPS